MTDHRVSSCKVLVAGVLPVPLNIMYLFTDCDANHRDAVDGGSLLFH